MTSCLSTFLVGLSDDLALEGRNNQSLKENKDRMVRTYYANDPQYDIGEAVLSELDSLEVVPLVLADQALFSIALAALFSLVVIIIIVKYQMREAVVAAVVVLALFLLGIYFILFSVKPKVTFQPIIEGDLERNRINRSLCAYSE